MARARKFGNVRYTHICRRYMKFDAEKIADARRKQGKRARITKVKVSGMRGYAYDVWGA